MDKECEGHEGANLKMLKLEPAETATHSLNIYPEYLNIFTRTVSMILVFAGHQCSNDGVCWQVCLCNQWMTNWTQQSHLLTWAVSQNSGSWRLLQLGGEIAESQVFLWCNFIYLQRMSCFPEHTRNQTAEESGLAHRSKTPSAGTPTQSHPPLGFSQGHRVQFRATFPWLGLSLYPSVTYTQTKRVPPIQALHTLQLKPFEELDSASNQAFSCACVLGATAILSATLQWLLYIYPEYKVAATPGHNNNG